MITGISSKYPICPIFSKVMLKFTENFSMTFAENRTYGVPEFAGTEVNRHSDKLKGLSGVPAKSLSPRNEVANGSFQKITSSIITSTTSSQVQQQQQ